MKHILITIVGAGAVVVEDVPEYSVVVGVPAKITKKLKNEDKKP